MTVPSYLEQYHFLLTNHRSRFWQDSSFNSLFSYRKTMSWWGRCSCCRTSRRGCRPGGAGRPAPRTSGSPCSASPPAPPPPVPGSPPGSLKKEKKVNFQLRCTELKTLMLAQCAPLIKVPPSGQIGSA
jgi:hypothetical protein